MIRFRLGQTWKREQSRLVQDSFGLDLDGVDILSTASEESLVSVVPQLIEAVSALYLDGESVAQLSLPEAHLEIGLRRHRGEVEISVVDLGRPARLARGPIRLELPEFAKAAVQCARTLVQDITACAPSLSHGPPIQRMLRQIEAIEHKPIAPLRRSRPFSAYTCQVDAVHPNSFGFELVDSEDLIAALRPSGRGALPSLLFGGSLFLRIDSGPAWEAKGLPFLLALEISRQGAELSRAIELQENRLEIRLGGSAPTIAVDLQRSRVAIEAREYGLAASDLARAMFNLGLALAYAVVARNANQRRNPYIIGLLDRCREGLAQLQPPVEPSREGSARAGRRPSIQRKPLNVTGRLRRLQFTQLWEKHRLGGEAPGKLLLSARGPVFASNAMACAFSSRGDLLFRRISSHGIAASADHWVVAASSDRVTAFVGGEHNARWIRDHDGLSVGPELERRDGLLLSVSGSRAVVAFSEFSGREMWRISPARAQHIFFTTQGHRGLIAADSGDLYGFDLNDGRVRYRLHAGLPFAGPTVPWGRRILATVGRKDRFTLIAADAHSGDVRWTRELELASMARPLPQGNRVLVAGERDNDGVLICLGPKGNPLWERRLHLGNCPSALIAFGRRIVACSPRGAAVSFSVDGQIEWRLGALENELLWQCQPRLARGVMVIPGETVRALDAHSGEVLAEVRAGIGLCDLKADSKLNLYLLDEDGTLRAYRLASHFAVVTSGK